MELTQHLRITPEEFFDQIERSAIDDIEEATGKTVSRGRLDGYKYRRRAAGGRAGTPMTVKIRHYAYPELYEVRFTYATGANTMRYEVAPDGGGCRVAYREDFSAAQPASGVLARIQLKAYEWQMRRHAKRTLAGIERLALGDRELAEKDGAADEAAS